jgi:hypothetical protein
MDIVSGKTVRVIQQEIHKRVLEQYKADETGGMVCKKCGSEIQQVIGHISIHLDCFDGCVGDGKVRTLPLPYCPECEGIPENTYTCVHVPFNSMYNIT